MAIKGITFDMQTVTSKDDGALYRMLAGYQDFCIRAGSGTFLTISNNVLTIGECFLVACGRYIHIQEGTTVNLGTISNTASQGRLIIRIDLTKSASELSLLQIETEVEAVTSGGAYRSLVQQNINADGSGTKYEVEFCRFTCSSGIASTPERTLQSSTAISSILTELLTKANAGLNSPTETDFDNITTAGWYWVNTAIVTDHKPVNSGQGFLEVIRTSGNVTGQIIQRFITSTPTTYQRVYVNSAWTSWIEFPNVPVPVEKGGTGATTLREAQHNLQNVIGYGVTLEDNSDLNNYFIPGVWRVGTTASAETITNIPEVQGGKLVCIWHTNTTDNNQYAGQFFFPNARNYYWYRSKTTDAGVLTPWVMIGQQGTIQVTYTVDSLTGLTASKMKVVSSEVLAGSSYGILTANRTYITLPPGTYRIFMQFNCAPGGDNWEKIALKTTDTTIFLATDKISSSLASATDANLVMPLNASGIIKLAETTNIYFLVLTKNDVSGGGTGYMTIEKIG